MSSLLRPVALESCHTGLRERRRSAVKPLTIFPPIFATGPHSPQEGSAVVDDNDISETSLSPVNSNQTFVRPTLTALTNVQLSNHASQNVIPRHSHSPSTISASGGSPSSSFTPTIDHESRKPSIITLADEINPNNVTMERLNWRLTSGFFAFFMCGWGDGGTGTILPYLMAEYNISYMMSSLLFAGSTIGFTAGVFLVESIINRLGCFDLTKTCWSLVPATTSFSLFHPRRRLKQEIAYSSSQARVLTLIVGSLLHGMFFVMMGSRGGYWVSFAAYVVAAFARCMVTTTLNAYFASGPKQSISYAYSLWSLGGVVSPFICQTMISAGVPWPKFYYGSLILSAINTSFLVLTFKPTATEFLRDRQQTLRTISNHGLSICSDKTLSLNFELESPTPQSSSPTRNEKTLITALKLPYQWAVCFFVFLYCGCENATQGLMVSYLLGTRNANPDTVGYVTSGFWGGITIGRILWGYSTPKLSFTQRKLVIQGCILIGLAMQVLIWTVNSNFANSLSASIIGLVYGPVFPACLALANDILPTEVWMVSMALISLSGSIGGALFPFIVGTISNTAGVKTLVYITVPLASSVAFLWALFPSKIPARLQHV